MKKHRKTGHSVNRSSVYQGVYWEKSRHKWIANRTDNGKRKHIGQFDNELDAARAVDAYTVRNDLDRELNFPADRATAAAFAGGKPPGADHRKKKVIVWILLLCTSRWFIPLLH